MKHNKPEIIDGLIIVFITEPMLSYVVFPAKAGNQLNNVWIPTFAGMTER